MARYIDADALIVEGWHLERQAPSGKVLSMMSIADVPTADVVEVVRCRKCEYYEPIGNGKKGVCTHTQMKRCLKLDEDYCSLGFKTKE